MPYQATKSFCRSKGNKTKCTCSTRKFPCTLHYGIINSTLLEKWKYSNNVPWDYLWINLPGSFQLWHLCITRIDWLKNLRRANKPNKPAVNNYSKKIEQKLLWSVEGSRSKTSHSSLLINTIWVALRYDSVLIKPFEGSFTEPSVATCGPLNFQFYQFVWTRRLLFYNFQLCEEGL